MRQKPRSSGSRNSSKRKKRIPVQSKGRKHPISPQRAREIAYHAQQALAEWEKEGVAIQAATESADAIQAGIESAGAALAGLKADILALVKRKPRGARVKQSTQDKILFIASALAQGRTERSFALEVFPEEQTRDAAYDKLRKFRSRHRKKIDPELTRLKSVRHA